MQIREALRPDYLTKPNRLEIEITKRCPLKCIHCSTGIDQAKCGKELPLRDITRVVSEFSQLGGKTISITGGEPFLRETSFVLEIIRAAKNCSLLTSVYTSGYLLDETLARELHGTEIDLVCISIEGTEKTHDMITGVAGSFERACLALKLLKEYKISTRIHFTPMRINYGEFQKVVHIGKSLGAKSIKIFEFSPQGRARENRRRLELAPEEMHEFASSAVSIINQDGLTIQIGGLITELSNSCSVGRKIAITCEGIALPCLGLQERLASFGNFGNVLLEPLTEIWKRIGKATSERVCLCNALRECPFENR